MNEQNKLLNGGLMGAITGDIIGSVYEWNNFKSKHFMLFSPKCFFTDDTVMSAAVAAAVMQAVKKNTEPYKELVEKMQEFGRKYPGRGYGGHFSEWIYERDPEPYNSWGNGAPMRCSYAGMLAESAEEANMLGRITAKPTHNHSEALKAAGLTAELIWRARHGETMEQLRLRAEKEYDVPFCDDLRPDYDFDVSSQGTMPASLAAFLESSSFEDAIRNAISLGGDSDTVAAITGSMAEAYWGIPDDIWEKASEYLDDYLRDTVKEAYAFALSSERKPVYKIETHMHTSEVSSCASASASEVMEMYNIKGFSTVIVTDHYSRNYFKYCEAPTYELQVNQFFDGYEAAKEAGRKYGITVLFALELRLRGSRNHYLVYGIDKEFLLSHPEITDMTVKEFYPLAKQHGFLVIQAHPFRGSNWPTPETVDGMEVRNTNPKHYTPDEEPYIEKIVSGYGLIRTAGSDTHDWDAAGLTGIFSDERIEDMPSFIRLLKSGKYSLI